MTLPTKSEIIVGAAFVLVGVLMLAFLPRFSSSGWNVIIIGTIFYLFPGPQLRDRYKQTEETQAQWRQRAKDASSASLNWWSSPFPWLLLIVLVALFTSVL